MNIQEYFDYYGRIYYKKKSDDSQRATITRRNEKNTMYFDVKEKDNDKIKSYKTLKGAQAYLTKNGYQLNSKACEVAKKFGMRWGL